MRVLVCGGRNYNNREAVFATLDHLHLIHNFTALCHGAAIGTDRIADTWSVERGIPCSAYAADWMFHGYGAGPRRNRRMLKEFKPDLVVAFPGGTGTDHMVRISKKAGVRVITYEDQT